MAATSCCSRSRPRDTPTSAACSPPRISAPNGSILDCRSSRARRDGLLSRTLETEGLSAARKLAARCKEMFGADRFFVEIQRNRVRGDMAISRSLIDVAESLHLGIVASGNVRYHTRSLHRLHDVMVAIRHRTTLDGSHRVRNPNSEFYLRPLDEGVSLFQDCPDAVATTSAIAQRCRGFDITSDLGYTFPDFRGADRAPAPDHPRRLA